MTAIPNYTVNFFAPVASGTTVTVGTVMLPDPATGQFYVPATAANRGTRGAEGIAVSVVGGSMVPSTVQLMQDGICPAEISLLPALTPGSGRQLVRTSTSGLMERVLTYTPGDDIIGLAEENGRVHLMFGFPWALLAGAGAGGPAGGDLSGTYPNPTVAKIDGTTVLGPAGTFFQGTGAAPVWSNVASSFGNSTGPIATIGTFRDASGNVLMAVRNPGNSGDSVALSTNASNVLYVGTDPALTLAKQFTSVYIFGGTDVRIGLSNTTFAMYIGTFGNRVNVAIPLDVAGTIGGSQITGSTFQWKLASLTASGTITLNAPQYESPILVFTSVAVGSVVNAPNNIGTMYIVINQGANALSFQVSGGTPVSCPAGKTTIVVHNGSNYVAAAASA